jgi:hypothetical protein
LHTPAQPSKRRLLPSVSPYKNRKVAVSESDSDGVYRDFLFDSSSSGKRGFKLPLQPWSLVKEWGGNTPLWDFQDIDVQLPQGPIIVHS